MFAQLGYELRSGIAGHPVQLNPKLSFVTVNVAALNGEPWENTPGCRQGAILLVGKVLRRVTG